MEKLKTLANVISELDKYSKKILSNLLPIMRKIEEKNNDIIDEISYTTELDKNFVTNYLQDKTLEMVSDAEKVFNEINEFSDSVYEGKETIEKNIKKYPFLAEVWFGDVYDDIIETEALKKLLEELKDTHKKADEDSLITNTISELTKENK